MKDKNNIKKKRILIGGLLSVLLAVIMIGVLSNQKGGEASEDINDKEEANRQENEYQDLLLKTGTDLEPFTWELLNGEEVNSNDFKGEKLVMTFFSTWCPACSKEIDLLEDLSEKYKDVNFLYVNLTKQEDSIDDVHNFNEAKGIKTNIALDKEGQSFDDYNVFATPTSILVNEEGLVEEVILGNGEKSTYEKIIK